MEREKGFESAKNPVISGTYECSRSDAEGSREPPEASDRVAKAPEEHRGEWTPSSLPTPSPDLFLVAGAVAADRAALSHAAPADVEQILKRAVEQAAALRARVP